MEEQNYYKQLMAFARVDGLTMGFLWIAIFACFVSIFAIPELSLAFNLMILFVPVLLYKLARRYRNSLPEARLSFGRAFSYCFYTSMFASLILAGGEFVYFQFMDNGYLFGEIANIIHQPEYATVFSAYNLEPDVVETMIIDIQQARPIDIVFNMLSQTLVFAVLMCALVALVVKKK